VAQYLSISVIIPTYNRAHTLPRALHSVLKQDHPVHEIIVVDDGSNDNTAQIIAKNFPSVHLIKQKNQGVSAARNSGIQAATGTWIALLDSDDCWLPSKLSRQIEVLEKNSNPMICHTNEIWIHNGHRRNPMKKHEKKGGAIFYHCLPRCTISPSTVMINKIIFKEMGYFDVTLPVCEDYDFWLRISARHQVLYVDAPLSKKYGGHTDQLSTLYWGMDRFRIQALDKLLKTNKLDEMKRAAVQKTLSKKCKILIKGAIKHKNKKMKFYGEAIMKYHRF